MVLAIVGTQDDDDLFQKEMGSIRRLPGVRRIADSPAPSARRPGVVDGAARLQVTENGEFISAVAAGVSAERLRALRRGEVPPRATLDLHGLTSPEAAARVKAFVQQARQADQRCVLVVHGRGLHSGGAGPVLRAVVLDTLARGPACKEVLALATAPGQHGGAGALLVLLRRG